ncbi:ABC transporter ATP-binding protein [Nonomuraea sp. NPDC059194]|uniref:ABC transporter ATP-binding protein n=1 Tax=Nonomuraea sp. NPDC059194 TaxID=3346764 RepID=UPI003677243D
MTEPVLEAVGVSKHFPVGRGRAVRAVEDATVRLYPGRTVALVGESGSGKTTLARILARYYPPTQGEIRLSGGEGHSYRRQVQLVYQDPFASLNPVHRVGYILGRVLRIHGHARGRAEVREQTAELLRRVNLPEEFLEKFPHELSGGQRQRVVIARALAVRPRVLLGDEPVSMLDVSIRLDILNLLARLRDEQGLAILYITHDIAGARYFSDEIHVMYAGQMVEGGPADSITEGARHPYTRLLLASAPDPDRVANGSGPDEELGEPPSLIDPPTGCRFHPRCPAAMDVCRDKVPPRSEHGEGHWTTCWLYAKDDE